MERRRSSLAGDSDASEKSRFGETQQREQQDKKLVDTSERVSEFINEEKRKTMSPGRNGLGNNSFHSSAPSTPDLKKNEPEGDTVDSTPTKGNAQVDANPSGLTTITEKKKRNKKNKGKKIEIPEYRQDPIATCLVDNIYYITSFIL